MMFLTPKRWKHFAAMALIGDGVMAVVSPERSARAWHAGPEPWRRLMKELHARPRLTRVIGAAQVAGAVWWALSEDE